MDNGNRRHSFFMDVGSATVGGSGGDAHAAVGQRFCIYHPPLGSAAALGAVVYLHPFAEEMNKSRRMAALQARDLAAAGYAVLQIDLLGCGDSSGDFGDASWDAWVEDALRAAAWLRARHAAPLWLWGLRAGCLLAVDAAGRLNHGCNFLFWQPPAAGKALLQQFLRLKLAGRLLEGKGVGAIDGLRATLAAGDGVDVAGYMLAPALADGLDCVRLAPPVHVGQSLWLEASTRAEAALLPATQAAARTWQQAGHVVLVQAVAGPAFWQTQEIEEAPALLAATRQGLGALAESQYSSLAAA